MKLSRRAAAISPSPTLAITARARALAAQGIDVVGLGAGEPDPDTPEHVKQAAIAAIQAGFSKYTATPGIPELRRAICRKLERENGVTYREDEVIATSGAKHALYEFFQAVVDDGDEVVIVAPYWVSYPDMAVLAGGKPVIVETAFERGFVPDPADIARKLTDRTVAVVINSPSNPTGAVWPRDVLAGVADVLAGHRAWVVTDDIYEHLLYTGEPFQNVLNVRPDFRDRTVVVNGLSKSFSMTGWRLGYAAGPRALIAAMQKIQDQSTSNPTSFVQRGAIAALEGPLDFVESMRRKFDERRRFVQGRLSQIPGVRCPEIRGAFYAFADFSAQCRKSFRGQPVGTSARLAEILLDEYRVAVIPGAPFGAEGYLRLSFATSMEQLSRGLDRIAACAAELT